MILASTYTTEGKSIEKNRGKRTKKQNSVNNRKKTTEYNRRNRKGK
jgi:hypothetical protein